MTCRCRTCLCYECGKQINGYEHFQEGKSKCKLWSNQLESVRIPERPIHENQRALRRILNIMPDQKKNIMNCINCGQQQLKLENNNHIKCWLCKTNMCFNCKKRLSAR